MGIRDSDERELTEGSQDPNVDPKTLAPNKRYIFNVGLTMSGGPNTSTPYIPDDQAYVRSLYPSLPRSISFLDSCTSTLKANIYHRPAGTCT